MLSFAKMKSQDEQHHNDATDESCENVKAVKSVAVRVVCELLYAASNGGRCDRRPNASKQVAAIKICGQGDQCGHQKSRQNVIFLVNFHNIIRYQLVSNHT